jgi:hypothetical protein
MFFEIGLTDVVKFVVDVTVFDVGAQQVDEGLTLLAVLYHQTDHGVDDLLQKLTAAFSVERTLLPTPLTRLQQTDLPVEVQNQELTDRWQEVLQGRALLTQLQYESYVA